MNPTLKYSVQTSLPSGRLFPRFSSNFILVNAYVHKHTAVVAASSFTTGKKLATVRAPSFEDRLGKLPGTYTWWNSMQPLQRMRQSILHSDKANQTKIMQPRSQSKATWNKGRNCAKLVLDHRGRNYSNEFKTWVLVSLSLLYICIYICIYLYLYVEEKRSSPLRLITIIQATVINGC